MKSLLRAVLIFLAPCAFIQAQAQTGPAGTWQAQGAPWVVELKVDGGVLTGTVAQQNGLGVEISEGKIEGNTVTFKVKVASGGVITFTGKIAGDEITFTREAKFSAPSANGEFGLFAPGGVTEFTVNRTTMAGAWTGTIRNAPTKR